MFKKNSWIAVLLLAAAVVFTGCIDAIAEEADTDTYTEVPLGEFNAWAGQVYQKGWAVEGIKFKGIGDKPEVAKDAGYKNEDFVNAKFLVIEMSDASLYVQGMHIIWGGENADGTDTGLGDWNQEALNVDGKQTSKDGNILKIDLTKALVPYAKYKTAAKTKIIIQSPNVGFDKLIVKAYLLVAQPKFVPITAINVDAVGVPDSELDLNLGLTFKPEDASQQIVKWSIVSFLPDGQDASVPANWKEPPKSDSTDFATAITTYENTYAGFTKVDRVVTAEKSYIDYSYLPPLKVVLAAAEIKKVNSDSVIIAKQAGILKVRALVEGGAKDEKNFTKEYDIEILNPFVPTLSASTVTFGRNTDTAASNITATQVTVKSAFFLSEAPTGDGTNAKLTYKGYNVWRDVTTAAVTSGGADIAVGSTVDYYVKSGTNYIINSNVAGGNDASKIYYKDDTVSYTPSAEAVQLDNKTSGGNWSYGNGANWVAIKLTLPADKKLQDYTHLMFTLTGVSGDIWWKEPLQVHVSKDPFDPLTAWLNNSNGAAAKTAGNIITRSDKIAHVQLLLNATSTTNEVYIALYYHVPGWSNGGDDAFAVGEFNYSNIKLIPKPTE